MKRFKKNGIIIILLTAFLMWYTLKDNFAATIKILGNVNLLWILVALIMFLIYFLLESLMYKIVINQYNKKYTYKKSLTLNIMTKFFNGITPFSTGGQPLQVYELNRDGVKPTYGTLVTVEQFLIFQTTVVVFAIGSIIINNIFDIVHADAFLSKLVVVGFSLNIIVLFAVFLLCTNINLSKKIIHFFIHLLSFLKIVKDENKMVEKWNKICDEYYSGYVQLLKNGKIIKKCMLIECFSLLFMFFVTYFVFLSLGFHLGDLKLVISTIIAIYAFFVGSFIPMPGGSGGIEYAFVGFFSYYVGNEYLSPALIIWRFITYYLPMIIGSIVFMVRNKRLSKIKN